MKEVMVGLVVSDRMEKTRVVEVTRIKRHPFYQKEIKLKKKFKVHDTKNESRAGDLVKIIECRPLSKDKRWRLLGIVRPDASA